MFSLNRPLPVQQQIQSPLAGDDMRNGSEQQKCLHFANFKYNFLKTFIWFHLQALILTTTALLY